MPIPIYKFDPTLVGRNGERYRPESPESFQSPSVRGYNTGESVINDYANNYHNNWGSEDINKTYVHQPGSGFSRSATPSFVEPQITVSKPAGLFNSNNSQGAISENSDSDSHTNVGQYDPLGKKARISLIMLRMVHTIAGLMLLVSIGGMQVYMLLNRVSILIIPLFVCRVFLMAAIVVLVLCDWSIPKKVHSHFPMYNNKRSWKGMGISQLVVAFFVLGDASLEGMEQSRDTNKFARVLFPAVLAFSSLMVAVGLVYFIAGAVGGSKLKHRFIGEQRLTVV